MEKRNSTRLGPCILSSLSQRHRSLSVGRPCLEISSQRQKPQNRYQPGRTVASAAKVVSGPGQGARATPGLPTPGQFSERHKSTLSPVQPRGHGVPSGVTMVNEQKKKKPFLGGI